MSNICKRLNKKITNVHPGFMFDMDMYNNVVGSLVVTSYILSENKPDTKDINKEWRKLKKKGLNYWLDDSKFFEKTLSKFGLDVPYGKFAMVQSEFNVLFLPYIDGQIYPVREDGILTNTALTGKIYPIEKGEDKE